MRHQHFDPDANQFIEHEHLHSGPHTHGITRRTDGSLQRTTEPGPGNYAPIKEDA